MFVDVVAGFGQRTIVRRSRDVVRLFECLTEFVSPSAVSIEAVCADDLLSVILYLLVKTEIPNW